MRRILPLVVLLFAGSITSYAQTKTGKVRGSLIDGNAKIIESSTVTLLRAKDSSVAKMGAADKNGHFEFENIDQGKYLVSISAVGHQKRYSEIFEITTDKNSIDLKTIELTPQTKELSGVTVTSRKPLIEQKIDRTIVNVDAAVSNVGATALEVLEKSPGVTVDKDGNISLKGKQGVQIYLDGRPSYLSGQDLVNLLKNMNASQLDQIEIMTNPPAKYDAAGNVVWAKEAKDNGNVWGNCIHTEPGGASVIGGYFNSDSLHIGTASIYNSTPGYNEIMIAAFDPNGNTTWATAAGSAWPPREGLVTGFQSREYKADQRRL